MFLCLLAVFKDLRLQFGIGFSLRASDRKSERKILGFGVFMGFADRHKNTE